ncbi:hypothetical protein [Psittacicella hinzii]|uniref:Uncharacterized protein n=1 Tax=Psittacicella hinzii TaxID=2028575 RepID=A0A3A1YEN6_9GAMM|nr:hypothetical protein [Psittacicella hinzii]RIY36011.1 hypothetical protein CKF58_06395 [Psittacicella hinzii]
MNEQTEIKQELLTRRLLRIAYRLDRLENTLVKMQLLQRNTQLLIERLLKDKRAVRKELQVLTELILNDPKSEK